MTDTLLNGLRILVVEDDYYLARDASALLQKAGGQVVGPFGTTEEAISALDSEGADLAVVDINLGDGPAFELARHLGSVKLPFLFATGYDQGLVPEDLNMIVRIEKPFSQAELISAAASVHQNATANQAKNLETTAN